MSPSAGQSSQAVRAAIAAALVGGAGGCFVDVEPEPFVGGDAFGVVSATKELAFALGDDPVRFRLSVETSPPSFDAATRAVLVRAARPVHLDWTADAFAGAGPEDWPVVAEGGENVAFPSGQDREDFRLSVTRLGGDTLAGDGPLVVTVRVVVSSPTDVDFDGVDDGVLVAVGDAEPITDP